MDIAIWFHNFLNPNRRKLMSTEFSTASAGTINSLTARSLPVKLGWMSPSVAVVGGWAWCFCCSPSFCLCFPFFFWIIQLSIFYISIPKRMIGWFYSFRFYALEIICCEYFGHGFNLFAIEIFSNTLKALNKNRR